MGARILSINTGSSSLKAALYDMADGERLRLTFSVDAIGQSTSHVSIRCNDSEGAEDSDPGNLGHDAALQLLLDTLEQRELHVDAVGHRIVYGGPEYRKPAQINSAMLAVLRGLVARDPQHMPQALHAAEVIGKRFTQVRQFACFDTAFHGDLPDVAQKFALPQQYFDAGLRRYGFHGLSCECIVDELGTLDCEAGPRMIVAHLGSGSSMTAIRDGRSIDTSMGFTPESGLVMGARAGDIDASVILHLIEQGMTTQAVRDLIGSQSGLLGISGSSADMRLLEKKGDAHAREAVSMYCYRAKKYLGSYVAALGGLDTLVFTGGIGEHSPGVRDRICAGLQCVGIQLDAARNQQNSAIISADGSRVTVRVMRTDEALMVARHTAELAGRSVAG